jgi:hypothetical protein
MLTILSFVLNGSTESDNCIRVSVRVLVSLIFDPPRPITTPDAACGINKRTHKGCLGSLGAGIASFDKIDFEMVLVHNRCDEKS